MASSSSLPQPFTNTQPAATLELEDDDLLITTDVNHVSLLCKVVTDKHIKLNIFQSAMQAAWGVCFFVKEYSNGLLQIFFKDEFEMFKILNGAPWQYKKFLVLLRPWEMGYIYKSSDFQFAPFWIQLCGIPDALVSKQLGTKIGKSIGEVLTCEIYNIRAAKVAKVRVNLDIFRPLALGITLHKGTEFLFQIDYHYESLSIFCFYCGIIGHEPTGCHQYFLDKKTNTVLPNKWSDDIRATEIGVKNYELSKPHTYAPMTRRLPMTVNTTMATNVQTDIASEPNLNSYYGKSNVNFVDASGKRERTDIQTASVPSLPMESAVNLGPVSKKKASGK